MKTKEIGMFAFALMMGVATFSQKSELKAAEKALKKKDYNMAVTAVNQAEGLIANADAKLQAKFYYLKGMALYGNGNNQETINEVAASFNKLFEVEKKSGNSTYSKLAGETLNILINKVSTDAQKKFNSANEMKDDALYIEAAKGYERVFILSPADTSFLYNSALLLSIGKSYEKSNEQYKQLLDLGYTGKQISYSATSSVNSEKRIYNTEKEMKSEIKLGIATDPVVEVTKSKVNTIIKAIATNYGSLGENEKALEFIALAREANPKDYDLVIEEANAYFRLGNDAMFKEKLEEAISLNPTNPNLFYNLGVMNLNLGDDLAAIDSFKKAIELDPEYGDAYNNLGTAILKRTEEVQKEMDANAMNFKKYDQIKEEKLFPIYREALPYFEKAYEIIKTDQLKNLVNSLYENLDLEKRIE